jgi:hypothetical protein
MNEKLEWKNLPFFLKAGIIGGNIVNIVWICTFIIGFIIGLMGY